MSNDTAQHLLTVGHELLRGFTVSHESIRRWEGKLLPVMGEVLRKRRHGIGRGSGQSRYVDGTYLKVHGRRCYLYRAIDRDGNLIDTKLTATRDMKAARRFFRSARSAAGFVPDRVTTDGHNSYPRVMWKLLTVGVVTISFANFGACLAQNTAPPSTTQPPAKTTTQASHSTSRSSVQQFKTEADAKSHCSPIRSYGATRVLTYCMTPAPSITENQTARMCVKGLQSPQAIMDPRNETLGQDRYRPASSRGGSSSSGATGGSALVQFDATAVRSCHLHSHLSRLMAG